MNVNGGKRMKKNKKRLLAGAMASLFVWNMWGWQPPALAGSSVYQIEEVKELPESVLHQEVAYGTKYRDLNLPDKLKVLVTKEEAEENENEEEEKTATPSEMTGEKSAVSEETLEESEMGGAAKAATPSEIDSSQTSDSSQTEQNWKEVKVRWVLDETFSEKTTYDGETPGVYVFDAELKNSRYELEEGFLPRIEITVLSEAADPLIAVEDENGIALLDGQDVVSVDISWGERMDFTYWDGPWDTTTHTYQSGSWKPTVSSNWIKVKNNGSKVNVEYNFSSEDASSSILNDPEWSEWIKGLYGEFTEDADGKGEPINSQTLRSGDAEQTVYLNLSSDKPPKALDDTMGVKLGTATVRISSSTD